MNDTLILLVTCTKESTRFEVLKQVVNNLSSLLDDDLKKDLLVFDNDSTYPGSIDLLKDNFKNVLKSKTNIGFWSAIFWCLKNYQKIMNKDYKYLYIIESDIIHFDDAFSKLKHCEEFLNKHNDVGFVRTEEFSVSKRNLYDKRNINKDSKRYAWVVQDNFIENKKVEFNLADKDHEIYTCNFLPKLPSLTRMQTMKEVFFELFNLKKFNETDYQKIYYKKYQKSAIIDGGIWHSKLGNENPHLVINGSRNYNLSIDYKPTRTDELFDISFESVVKL